jgi:UPF0755 protein
MAKKKKFSLFPLLLLVVVAVLSLLWFFGFRVNTSFQEERKYLLIRTGWGMEQVMTSLRDSAWLSDPSSFQRVASWLRLGRNIHPGRYEITRGMGNYALVSMLKKGRQKPVRLVINKLRTRQDLIRKLSREFEADSVRWTILLSDSAFLQEWNLDTAGVLAAVMPATYELYWNTPAEKIFRKIAAAHERYWNEEKRQQAAALGLTPLQVITIASIVEEETNEDSEKPQIAGVYLNRYRAGMPLGADPTVKFALRDFGLRRILNKHTAFDSPYNTYKVQGLPPGPICNPSQASIAAVLQPDPAPNFYFCAKEDFSGFHRFAKTYEEHLQNARRYQQALNERAIR